MKAWRVMLKVDVVDFTEDGKASSGNVFDAMVYEKDFGRSVESVVAEVLALVEKQKVA